MTRLTIRKILIDMASRMTARWNGGAARQTVRNPWHDGSLFAWSTWASAWKLLFSSDGMVRGNYALWKAYKSPTFHPRQQDTSRSVQWLRDNSAQVSVLGQGA